MERICSPRGLGNSPFGAGVIQVADTNMMAGGVNKMVAMIAGAVLALVGLLGFAMDPVLGVFEVSMLHNIVHLLSGLVLLGVAFMNNGVNARITLLVLGAVYAIVAILGFIAAGTLDTLLGGTTTAPANNMADNVLHVLLAVVFIAVPLVVKEDARRPVAGNPRL